MEGDLRYANVLWPQLPAPRPPQGEDLPLSNPLVPTSACAVYGLRGLGHHFEHHLNSDPEQTQLKTPLFRPKRNRARNAQLFAV